MKKIALSTFLLILAGAFFWSVPTQSQGAGTAASIYKTLFSGLGTPVDSSVRYCSDCQATTPCSSGGTGAFANRVNGVWNCAAGGGGAPGISCSGCSVDTLTKYNGSALVDSTITDDGTSLITSATVFRPSSGGGTNLGSSIRPFGNGFLNNVTIAAEASINAAIRTGVAADTDLAGLLTVGAGGTVTYTFTQTYASAPVCVSSDTDAVPLITGASTTTTTLTVTGTVGHVVSYICVGRN